MNARQLRNRLEAKRKELEEILKEIDYLWDARQRQFSEEEEKSNEQREQLLEKLKNEIETEINHLLRQL